jgi:hypothetical protein
MKNANQQQSKPAPQINKNQQRPENKDNLDSREGEEQIIKGDDITHNKKETKDKKKNSRR